jgi:hypothetical protein
MTNCVADRLFPLAGVVLQRDSAFAFHRGMVEGFTPNENSYASILE